MAKKNLLIKWSFAEAINYHAQTDNSEAQYLRPILQ